MDIISEPNISPVSIAHKITNGDASYPYHRHNYCEVILFQSGNIDLYIEHTCFHLTSHDLVILNPNEMHRVYCLDDSTYERVIINLQPSYLDCLSHSNVDLSACFFQRSFGTNNILHLQEDEFNRLFEYSRMIDENNRSITYGSIIRRDAYTSLLMVDINSLFSHSTTSNTNILPNYITESILYIKQHSTEGFLLSALASHVHMSANYLSEQFKKHTGLTIREYLLDCKIQQAKKLLQNGANVTEACFQSGFNNYSNFLRSFKNIEGISPGRYKCIY